MTDLPVQSSSNTGARKLWFVTGASSGLGLAIVKAALEHGHRVAAAARNATSLTELASQWPDALTPYTLDVTDLAAASIVIDQVTRRHGPIDVLVNNAGRAQIGAVEETSDHELRALFDLHVFGPMELVRLVLPQMRAAGGGLIIQMSSMGSVLIKPGFSAYSATKAALEGMSATLATEVAQFGIDVMIVQPGSHRTNVFAPESRYMVAAMPEYNDLLTEVRNFVGDADGTQPGDPALAAQAIVGLADQGPRPMRLVLGADAVHLITAGLAESIKEIDAWKDISLSTAQAGISAEDITARHESTRAHSIAS